MLSFKRDYTTRTITSKFKLLPEYKLKCGLEIHTQLSTINKLFSLSTNNPFADIEKPNYHTSYFDISLPGTQPLLNYEVVLYALRLSLALNCKVNLNSHFDRKHYFYGDQPLGYQITQHYSPFSGAGKLRLFKELDAIDEPFKDIAITQLQIEQDTGKSTYDATDSMTKVDLNRSNVPLIEMVTEPDFTDLKQIRAFIKKYQNLVRHLKISTGDLETGAMRVDVNLSINDHARVELKNLPNTSSMNNAIKYEYMRQVKLIQNGEGNKLNHPETRGWTGSETVKLRSKESVIDYRYMPDPELPNISLDNDVVVDVQKTLPLSPDDICNSLLHEPYKLSLKDAKILTFNSNGRDDLYSNEELRDYYLETFKAYKVLCDEQNIQFVPKLPANWIIHELLGNMNKLEVPLKNLRCILPPEKFADLLVLISDQTLSNSSGKLLLSHILNNFKENPHDLNKNIDFEALIDEYDLHAVSNVNDEELEAICRQITNELNNDKMIRDIVSGKKKGSLKFLVGQGMRLSQGRVNAQKFEQTFKKILNVNW